jgi:hypothetical protein
MRGFIEAAVLFALVIIAEVFLFSTSFMDVMVRNRHSVEYEILFEGDKIETYVHSFLQSADLSLIQSVYDVGKNNVIYDYSLKYYKDGIPYWQIYDQSFIPSNEEMQSNISFVARSYINSYLDAYVSYAKKDGYSVSISKLSEDPQVSLDQNKILLSTTQQIQFLWSDLVDNQNLKINRSIPIDSSVSTVFMQTIDVARYIVENDLINQTIAKSTDQNQAQQELNDLAKSLSNGLLVNFRIVDFQKTRAIVLVEISDQSVKYPFYSYSQGKTVLDTLGVRFYVKVGSLVDDLDEFAPVALNNFKECVKGEIGIISSSSSACNLLNKY